MAQPPGKSTRCRSAHTPARYKAGAVSPASTYFSRPAADRLAASDQFQTLIPVLAPFTVCETCTFFANTIGFRPTLQAQHDHAAAHGHTGRQELFAGLLNHLDQAPAS